MKKCDFLTVSVDRCSPEFVMNGEGNEVVSSLPADYFHAVVFSLLLEYLPVPHMRYTACKCVG